MLNDYLKRKGLVIADPWIKNRILVHLVSNMQRLDETEDEFIERIMKSLYIDLEDITIKEGE